MAVDPVPHFAAAGVSAFITFPLWKAATIGQASFKLKGTSPRYLEALRPPWKGAVVVVSGMTWQRAAIFFGSDFGSQLLHTYGVNEFLCTVLPPLIVSTCVQFTIQPLVRSTVMLQDPQSPIAATSVCPYITMLNHILTSHGVWAWWHGTSVGIIRTAPKYAVAVSVKTAMEQFLDPTEEGDKWAYLLRSAKKSVTAGICSAVITNPFDVLRNEMFKSEEHFGVCFKRLCRDFGAWWLVRGCETNLLANAVPIACTVFLTDAFLGLRNS